MYIVLKMMYIGRMDHAQRDSEEFWYIKVKGQKFLLIFFNKVHAFGLSVCARSNSCKYVLNVCYFGLLQKCFVLKMLCMDLMIRVQRYTEIFRCITIILGKNKKAF